jgi:glycosyltransferase involved in cell wall biosynthesis
MNRESFRPAVLVWNPCETDFFTPQIRALGVTLYSLPCEVSAIKKIGQFRCLVKELKPEVIHSYSFYLNVAASWAAWGTRVVAVGAVRGDFVREIREDGPWLGRLNARWPRHQICNSNCAAENSSHTQGLSAGRKLTMIRNAVDLECFPMMPLESRAYRRRILGVGSLLPVKRWDRLVKAASELKKRRVDCLIQIAGAGPLRDLLTQEATDLGVAERVQFLGHRDDIPDLLADAAFLVHPSDSEGCPNAVIEAMACGRAVVATNVGDIPHLVADGETGFVVTRGDDVRLVDCMLKLLAEPELCRRMGEAGRQKAEQELGLDRLVEETFVAYRSAGWTDS